MKIHSYGSKSLFLGGVFAFLFNHEGKFLVLKEDLRKRKYDWDLPGGTLESNETHSDGLIREVKEETGLSIQLLSPFNIVKWGMHESGYPILVTFFLAEAIPEDQTIVLSKEHVMYRWLNKEAVIKENLTIAPSIEIISSFQRLYFDLKRTCK